MLRDGNDLTLIAAGEMVWPVFKAAEIMQEKGISARVLDMHTIKPLDEGAIQKAAEETRGIITVEEHSIYGGLGSAVAEKVVQAHPVPVKIIGIPDEHIIAGESDEVFPYYGLDYLSIAGTAMRFVEQICKKY